jgi:DNA repair protein RadC
MTGAGHEGHRARLLARYGLSGISSLADYEIIELILTFVIPRRDTKPVAKELVRKYKTLSGLFHADTSDLAEVKGIGTRAATLLSFMRDMPRWPAGRMSHLTASSSS